MRPRNPITAYLNPLHELVDKTMTAKDLTSVEVARRGGIAIETVGVLRRGREQTAPLRHSTMLGLAKGLGVPYSAIQEASYASLPRPLRDLDADTQAVVALMRAASPAQRKRMRRVVEASAQ